jgi:hypothetical protein
MNIQQAKAIPIAEILQRMGQLPSKQRQDESWYKSPIRDEKTASFHVNTKKNIWFDFGLGIGGDNIELVCQYLQTEGVGNSVPDALRWLDNMFDHAPKIKSVKHEIVENEPESPKLSIRAVKNLYQRVLENYLSDRGIPITIGARYLKELRIHNHETGNHFIALGFKNEDEGYEIRNKRFKGSVKAKNISFIRGSIPGNKEIHLFEGVFDYLTAITQNHGKHFEGDVIVLNSIALLSKATPYLKGYGYKILYSWMDNDEAGKRATQALQEFAQTEEGLRHIPMNDRYAPYKDVNAAHMAKLGLSME